MFKNIKLMISSFLCSLFFMSIYVNAQGFKIDINKNVSVVKKFDEVSESNGEYLNQIFLQGPADEYQILDEIYFSSEFSHVSDAFGLDMDFDGLEEIVLILVDEVKSDPGEGNVGPYISVNVYKKHKIKHLKNEKISNFFSGGIDKVVDPGADKLIYKYIYPYKTKADVKKFISSSFYKSFYINGFVDFTLKSKVRIYKELYNFESKMHLVAGDKIKIIDISGGWATFVFESSKNGSIQAFAKLSDLEF